MGREGESAALESALASHGEAFMSMFDDHVAEGKGMQIRRKKRKTQQGKEATAHSIHTDEEVEEQDQECDDVDSIFKGIHTYMQGENDGEILKAGKKKSHSVTTAVASSRSSVDDVDSEDELVRRRIEKKRFMSSKADVILGSDVSGRHGGGPARQKKKKKKESSKGLPMEDKEEFKKLSREIQHFGASGLDKKSRAKFEENALLQLGAKKKKGARIPASIGIGMARKAAQREKRALEQAIAAGMVSRKSASTRREQGKSGIDRGLNEDRGAFKAGVLRINRGATKSKARGP